jgi:hypothetical protein
MASRDVVDNLVGTWKLSLRALKPEYVGLLVEAVEYLDSVSEPLAWDQTRIEYGTTLVPRGKQMGDVRLNLN